MLRYPEFASQMVERKDVGNAPGVKVNMRVTKISVLHSGHSATVTMPLNWFLGRAHVLYVSRVCK